MTVPGRKVLGVNWALRGHERAWPWLVFLCVVAMAWELGRWEGMMGGLGIWLGMQGGYVLLVEWVRRGDCQADLAEGFALGSETADTAMVLLHGFADTPEAWRREAVALAGKGFRVMVPCLSHEATEAEWFAEVEAVVRAARERHRHVVLWGHSMGGAVALAVAERVRPDALVLWAPFLAPRLGRVCVSALYALHRLLFIWPHTLTWFPAERRGRGMPSTYYRVRRVIPTRTFAAMLRMQYYACAAKCECPTLVVVSQRDRVVDNRVTRKRLPKATFLNAADVLSGHALTNAVDWKDNLEASLSCWNRLPAAQG